MPTAKQIKVEIPPTSGKISRTSSSNTIKLQSLFATSPIHRKDINDDERLEYYRDKVLSGEQSDEGHTFSKVNLDFAGIGDQAPPSYGDVETGDKGKPASAWVPNPASPGAGNGTDFNSIPETKDYGKMPTSTSFQHGDGSQLSPKDSSAKIGAMKLGSYLKGKSTE